MKLTDCMFSTSRWLTLAFFSILALCARADSMEDMLAKKYVSVKKQTEYKTGTVWYSVSMTEKGTALNGAVDAEGHEIIPPKYWTVSLRGNRESALLLWLVWEGSNKAAVFDYGGKQLTPFTFSGADIEYSSGDRRFPYVEVEENGKYGALNINGKRILPSEFDRISFKEEGDNGKYLYYWRVYKDDKAGVYSPDGKPIVPCQYKTAYPSFDVLYGDWLYYVESADGKQGIYDLNGKLMVEGEPLNGVTPNSDAAKRKEPEYTPVQLALMEKYPGTYVSSPDKFGNYLMQLQDSDKSYYFGLFNADGHPLLDPADRYSNIYVMDLPSGGSCVFAATKEVNSKRLYDSRGNEITKEGYDLIELNNSQPDVLSYFKISRRNDEGYTHGALALDGTELVPCEYAEVSVVQNPKTKRHLFLVKQASPGKSPRYGAYGLNGDFLAEAVYPHAESLFSAVLNGEGVLDYLKHRYHTAKLIHGSTGSFKAYEVQYGLKYGIADKNGKLIAPCEYQSVKLIGNNPKQMAYEVYKDGKKGVLDLNGKQIIPCKYSSIKADNSGGYAVRKEDKWGYCNSRGEEVLPSEYKSVVFIPAEETGPDYIRVTVDSGEGAFSPSGSLIVPARFDDVYNLEGTAFGGYKFLAHKGSNYGLYAWDGTEIVPCKYSEVFQCTHPAVSGCYYVGETPSGHRDAFTSRGEPMAIPQPVNNNVQQQGTDWRQLQQQFAQLTQDFLAITQRAQNNSRHRPAGAVRPVTPPTSGTPSGYSSGNNTSRPARQTTGADVQHRATLQRVYDSYGSSLSAMNYGTYPYSKGYTMQEVREAQSKMRSIRQDWNSKHPDIPIYEDSRAENWNGMKGSM